MHMYRHTYIHYRQTDIRIIQTDKYTYITEGRTDRKKDGQRDRQKYSDREIGIHIDRHFYRQTDTERQTDRCTYKQTDTYTQHIYIYI